jgi:hypothetical protein
MRNRKEKEGYIRNNCIYDRNNKSEILFTKHIIFARDISVENALKHIL